ncbi:hypothetical protein PMZ80_005680 [Knufia obscura]|uniref:C2H2-type domain-containing protein n=1 Tax=Knufia obscura TaxID=1635080 RepID=A0ABR0RM98_9EURO|nr:hypothetical protein PMZ80_005680 [Knufia obscura]
MNVASNTTLRCFRALIQTPPSDQQDADEASSNDDNTIVAGPLTPHPLVAYFRGSAISLGVEIQFAEQGQPPYDDLDQPWFYYDILYRPSKYDSISGSQSIRDTTNAQKSSGAERDIMYSTPGFYHTTTQDKPYTLVPECRSCLTVFVSDDDLRQHLQEKPSHAVPFRKKRWNTISHLANRGGRICWSCGYSCSALCTLEAHLDKKGHWRHGIIPRYTEDNRSFDTYWKKHLAKHGWL